MKSYYVYIVRCSDNSLYTGIAKDADVRVAQHNLGIDPGCYTFMRRPVELVYASEFHEVMDAIDCEKKLKRWTRAKKEALIAGDWLRIHELARCRHKK